ncbi:hypothetical protein JCM21714_34 [Gracilibacillus boraciitolerans JCM 21714]|uniref:YhaN AAA domain-containing protein n=1 Tax=Gracilibacillus boraciitolerans JCM 21714 TaxID=1298598 RepID=W4VE56_9BACI|nr:AAA family ATPase [Gracilibacillus boraciitolerans]GAE91098.1 hypothetical protein JCM21714_34 [Gracilibacillus boraciitolerans JCM 21714]
MRFDYLHLEAFGHFTNYELLFEEDKNFHILYGPNEAGKSTILRSVSNLLYGFPQQTTDSFLHSNQKLRVGGRLTNKHGETLSFYRRKGRKNTVLDWENQPLDEKRVQTFLDGMSEQQFVNMFALDHVRLREGGASLLQSDGHVGESLFSAASGISVLRRVLDELENNSRDLYLKSGSKPVINQAIKEEKELTKQISDNQLKVQTWKDLEQSYLDGERKIAELKQELKMLSTEETKYRRLKQTLPKIALRNEMIDKRKELENVPELSENAEEKRKECVQKSQQAEDKLTDLTKRISQIDNELAKVTIPDGLVEQEVQIEGLNREVEGYRNHREQIPVLEGRHRQLAQQVHTALKELDVSENSMEQIERYRMTAAKKKSIRELCDQYPLLEQERKTANKEFDTTGKDVDKQSVLLDQLGESIDVDTLEQVINQVKEEGKLEARIYETQIKNEQLKEEIAEAINRLPLFSGTSEELMQLQVPSLTNTVKKYDKKQQELTKELREIQEKIDGERESKALNNKRIRELESVADIPTEDLLQTLRQHRDTGWLVIRDKLNDKVVDDQTLQAFTQGLPLDLAFEKSISESDDTADTMRREAEKLGEKNKLISDIEVSEQSLVTLENKYTDIEAELTRWKEEWVNEWSPARINPLTPEEMIEWLEEFKQIRALILEEREIVEERNRLIKTRDQLYHLLKNTLTDLITISPADSLAELVDQAEKTRKELSANESHRHHLQAVMNDLQEKLKKTSDRKEEADKQMEQWNEKWEKASRELSLPVDTSPAVAKELIEMYEDCVRTYDEMKQVENEIKSINERIDFFHDKVNSLDQSFVQATENMAVDVVVTQLYQALNQAKQDKVKLENLKQQRQQLQQEKELARQTGMDAKEELNELLKQANCDTLEELEKVEIASNQKRSYKEKISQIEEDIVGVGNGLTLEQLLVEAEETDIDLVDHELDELTHKRDELDGFRSEFEQEHGS